MIVGYSSSAARHTSLFQESAHEGVFTPSQENDECEVGAADEHDIESFEPREDAPKSIEPTEQSFDLGSPLLH